MPRPSLFYFAYGSNLLLGQMARRCPRSHALYPALARGWRWCIGERGYATLAASSRAITHGALYALHAADESALDACEGVARGCYGKFFLDVEFSPEEGRIETIQALAYIDPRSAPGEASDEYLRRCINGAIEWGLPRQAVNRMRSCLRAPF